MSIELWSTNQLLELYLSNSAVIVKCDEESTLMRGMVVD